MVSFPLSPLSISLVVTLSFVLPLRYKHFPVLPFILSFHLSLTFPPIFPSDLSLAFYLDHRTRPTKQTMNLKIGQNSVLCADNTY